MTNPCLSVASGLLLYGRPRSDSRVDRADLFRRIGVSLGTFRSAGELIGAHHHEAGLRFFDSSTPGRLAFGPGAGLALGISLGTQSLRAMLVDANGLPYCHKESPYQPGQLGAEPRLILGRIAQIASEVLEEALLDERLHVDGALPFLGCAVAWPTPIDRDKHPVGHALAHPGWRSGQPLDQRVRNYFGIREIPSYALNDTHAAAIAIAHDQTHSRGYERWRHPRLAIVLRIGGGIGGAVVIVEPPQAGSDSQRNSGFIDSVLIGGVDNHAGEIGHTPINAAIVSVLNKRRPSGLAPLTPWRCTCTPHGDVVPAHLEAYSSATALAARLDPEKPMHEVLAMVLDDQVDARHARALNDVGTLVGEALVSPVAVLNPATITLTGALAVPAVRDRINERLEVEHRFGTEPEVVVLDGDDNKFIRAHGAALALMRDEVHRRLPELLVGDRYATAENVKALTLKLRESPLTRRQVKASRRLIE